MIVDRNLARAAISAKIDSLKQEIRNLDAKVSKLDESVDSLNKLQHRWVHLAHARVKINKILFSGASKVNYLTKQTKSKKI